MLYKEISNNIEIAVNPYFVPEHSEPKENRYLFAYHIVITNHGHSTARLISRHWTITDGSSRVEEVKGEGVVGVQPLIPPGESFEYTSACPLTTPTGNMRGSYLMVDENGNRMRIKIPLFFLRHPSTFH